MTQANWVKGYGTTVVDLTTRGYLPSLLDNEASIARALAIGREWLGAGHPAVECLKVGVAIHHGRLPNPFLRELEALLAEGVLKVIVASPTLSQGLNFNAAVLLVPSLHRSGKLVSGEEFANVAGRAGRAFVDVEGLIVHVMNTGDEWRLTPWRELVASAKARTLQSGLIQVVAQILVRLTQIGVLARDDALEYLANSREAWKTADEAASDDPDPDEDEKRVDEEPLSQLVEKLDAVVFGLIEALDADSEVSHGCSMKHCSISLWARQMGRKSEATQRAHKAILEARAKLIWNNTTVAARRGHFAMGVGLRIGFLALDDMADELATFLDEADDAALGGNEEALAGALIELGRRLLSLRPFVPDNSLPTNWEALLKA